MATVAFIGHSHSAFFWHWNCISNTPVHGIYFVNVWFLLNLVAYCFMLIYCSWTNISGALTTVPGLFQKHLIPTGTKYSVNLTMLSPEHSLVPGFGSCSWGYALCYQNDSISSSVTWASCWTFVCFSFLICKIWKFHNYLNVWLNQVIVGDKGRPGLLTLDARVSQPQHNDILGQIILACGGLYCALWQHLRPLPTRFKEHPPPKLWQTKVFPGITGCLERKITLRAPILLGTHLNTPQLYVLVLVCEGCCNTVPQTGWLKQQHFVVSRF